MLQIRVCGASGILEYVVKKLPFIIGKGPSTDLRIESPGIWDQHLVIDLDRSTSKYVVETCNESLLTINHEAVTRAFLRNGDSLRIGACELVVGLSPTVQRANSLQELSGWGLITSIILVETALLFLVN